MKLHVAHRTRPKRGEDKSGDAVFVRDEAARTLLAVIDALGHGAEAEDAASHALAFLESAPSDDGVKPLVSGLHRALRGTRGAAATVCLFEQGTLVGCGVGNVELRARGTRIPFVLSPGILGSHHSALRLFRQPLGQGDYFAVFSDGIQRTMSLDGPREASLEDRCDRLFDAYATPNDDVTLLLAEVRA